MKKLIGFTIIILLTLLFITKSLYVEWNEIFIIIGAATSISLIYNYFKNRTNNAKLLGSSSVIGFIFCWVFGSADLIIDHYLYFLPGIQEDGAPLTLGFKVKEFNDSLFQATIMSMVVVTALTFGLTKIISFSPTRMLASI